MNPRAAIKLTTVLMNTPDCCRYPLVSLLMGTGLPLPPGIVTTLRHSHGGAHCLNRILSFMLIDHGVTHLRSRLICTTGLSLLSISWTVSRLNSSLYRRFAFVLMLFLLDLV